MEKKAELSTIYQTYAVMMVLWTGAYAGVSSKFAYGMKVEGNCGINKFTKPYFFTLFMFVGEAMCLAYFYAEKVYTAFFGRSYQTDDGVTYPKADDGQQPNARLLDNGHHRDSSASGSSSSGTEPSSVAVHPPGSDLKMVKRKPPVWFFLILSCFDLSATTIGGIGLEWVTASANQMLRGSMILFTALWTLLIFRVNLSARKWLGIAITMGGLVLVGGAGMLDPNTNDANSATSDQVLIGIVLVLAGSALNACQGVLEEKLMKGLGDGVEADPMEVVGWEGVFGCMTSSFIMLPIVQAMHGGDCGSVENTYDTLKMLHNSPALTALMVFYAVSLAFMNNYSQVVSKHLSAVHRMLLNTCRVVLVWVIDLIIFYKFSKDNGEGWDDYSFMQLGGFFLLIAGSAVYVRAALAESKAAKALAGMNAANEQMASAKLPVPVNGGGQNLTGEPQQQTSH